MDDDGAARWAIRRDAGPLTPDEQQAFEAWLAADERREGSLLRAEAALVYLDRGPALIEVGDPPFAPEEEAATPSRVGRRHFPAGGSEARRVGEGGGRYCRYQGAA